MPVFDTNVQETLVYSSSVADREIKHALLVSLVKDKARYRGVDLFELFYFDPFNESSLNDEKEACNYLVVLPLLQKLYDVASACGKERSIKLGAKPTPNEVTKITKKIEIM